jgi:N-carbamoylputrescine amidase
MPRVVRSGLIQMSTPDLGANATPQAIKQAMLDKHLPLIDEAGQKGVQILCLQEIFNTPYFCPAQSPEWFSLAEAVPGPTIELMATYAKKYSMAMVVPIYEREMAGVFYNTAAVLDADGSYLGKYRKMHIPDTNPGFFEKYYFKPGNLGFRVFKTKYATIAPYICYDRHFPEGARILGLKGAEIVYNPSATVEGKSQYLWKLEQPAQAVANGYYVGAINRVGTEAPWNIGKFYGTSYFCDPRGQLIATASDDKDELLVTDLDLDVIEEVRKGWQFFRDRRPDAYQDIVRDLP